MHATRTNRYFTRFTTLALLAAAASCADDNEDAADAGALAVAPATSTPASSTTPPASTVASTASGPASGNGSAPASSSQVSSPSARPATIPDGVYRRVATVAEGEAKGLDPQLIREMAGRDGQIPVAFETSGDSWKHLVTNDAGDRRGRGPWYDQLRRAGPLGNDEPVRVVPVSLVAPRWSSHAPTCRTGCDGDPDDVRFVTEGDFVLDEGGPAEPAGEVVLAFAHPLLDLPEQIIAFATEVRDRSAGSITFDVRNDAGAEAGIVAGAESGAVDLAWVGARAFPEFDPLLAPLLVDSYELQSAVYEAGIPGRLGESLADRGLQPIAVLPGPLTKMLGVDRSLVRLEDFAGARVGTMPSELSRSTISALGAEPVDARPQMPLDGLNGLQTQLGSVYGNDYQQQAHSVTANLNLAPRDLVVVMSAERFAELTPEQQEILLAAGAAAVEPAAAASVREDERVGPELCASPMEVLEATAEDLEAIEQALSPVYADVETDVHAAAAVAEIRAIKEELGAPPASLTC